MNTYDQKQKASLKRAAGRSNTEQATGAHAPAQSARPEVATLQRLRQSLDGGPRVQSQLVLGRTFEGGAHAVTQARLAATLGSVAQLRMGVEEDELKAVQAKCDSVTSCDEENDEAEKLAPRQESVEPVQGKFQPATAGGVDGSQGGLPEPLRAGIETLSGVAMNDVQVEYNSPEPAKINALATTQGKSIQLGPGQEKHLPHEAWHAAQQKQGRVRATTQLRGLAVNDNSALEHEADVMGARAARMLPAGGPATEETTQRQMTRRYGAAAGVTQRQGEDSAQDKVSTDTGAELAKAIAVIKKVAEAGEPNEQTRELAEYVAELEEIARGDDEELKAETLDALDKEAERQAGASLEEVSDEASDLTSGAQAEPVVQGNFIWTFLTGLVGSHPYAALATTVTVVGLALLKVKAEKTRQRLPRAASANLFREDKRAYWAHMQRYIQQYCKLNGVSANDKSNLERATIGAINNSPRENNLVNYYGDEARSLNWNNARLSRASFFNDDIFDPFVRGIDVITRKDIAHANVSQTDLAGFTAALRKLPFVQALYAGKVLGGQTQKSKKKKTNNSDDFAQWGDGGKLDAKIQLIDDGNPLSRARGDVDNGQLNKRVLDADRFIRRLVEPEILSGIPRPTIAVHLRNSMGFTSPFGLRAYTSGNEVHIAQNQTTDIIVHELGHYLEDNMPLAQWAETQALLQKRKGAGQKAEHISPVYFNEKLSFDEQRYPGNYPATGRYTSRYYTGGATEVTSRTVEYLAHPTRFKTLIETDPQQAALILRLLRPNEFARLRALDPYVTKYLPT